jgi:hypothetical protein
MSGPEQCAYRVWIEGPNGMPRRYFPVESYNLAEALFKIFSDTEDKVNIALEVFDELKLTWKIHRRSTIRSRRRRKMKNG